MLPFELITGNLFNTDIDTAVLDKPLTDVLRPRRIADKLCSPPHCAFLYAESDLRLAALSGWDGDEFSLVFHRSVKIFYLCNLKLVANLGIIFNFAKISLIIIEID